jgi:N-acetylglutamate synthase-like GNAT family acetyltransferase
MPAGPTFAVCGISTWNEHRALAQVIPVPGFETDEEPRRVARRTQVRGKRATAAELIGRRLMSVHVRSASLQDGVAVLALLEEVGYYPEPISFAKTYRKTLADPHFLVRVAEVEGKIVGMATLSMRWQLGLGGLLACLDELAVAPGHKGVDRALMQATVGKARGLGARRIVVRANEGTPPPRAAQLREMRERAQLAQSA